MKLKKTHHHDKTENLHWIELRDIHGRLVERRITMHKDERIEDVHIITAHYYSLKESPRVAPKFTTHKILTNAGLLWPA